MEILKFLGIQARHQKSSFSEKKNLISIENCSIYCIFIENVLKNRFGREFRNDTFYFENFNLSTGIYSYLRFNLLTHV